MELTKNSNTLIFTKILVFMDKNYFENFLKSEKFAYNNIEITIGDNYLPGKLKQCNDSKIRTSNSHIRFSFLLRNFFYKIQREKLSEFKLSHFFRFEREST